MERLEKNIIHIASLLADKSRALMLWYLLDGKAYTATELACVADISAQSASNHLAKLIEAAILKVEKQGRHRYYTFASSQAAYAIEALNTLVEVTHQQTIPSAPISSELTRARTCYDHLAGKLGVELTQSLVNKGMIHYHSQVAFTITAKGERWLTEWDIDLALLQREKRKLAFPCLDWSERKHHLAGALGTALLKMFLDKEWMKRKKDSRVIILTSMGELEVAKLLKSL